MDVRQRLRLVCVVFEDGFQNLILTLPELPLKVGVYDRPERLVRGIRLAMTGSELRMAVESIVDLFEKRSQESGDLPLIDRVRMMLENPEAVDQEPREDESTGAA